VNCSILRWFIVFCCWFLISTVLDNKSKFILTRGLSSHFLSLVYMKGDKKLKIAFPFELINRTCYVYINNTEVWSRTLIQTYKIIQKKLYFISPASILPNISHYYFYQTLATITSENNEDMLVWRWSPSGVFTTHSYYNWLIRVWRN
jgi:hypothetical protein